MRLYIGKNHQRDDRPVQSLFRLVGNDEDALTYALGFLLAQDPEFCRKVLRLCSVRVPGHVLETYTVRLQEVTVARFGRRDIVIEGVGTRVVLEAKIGRSEPTVYQLCKYADEDRLWANFERRAIVALTQVELLPSTGAEVSQRLSRQRITFSAIQWHQILELVLRHTPSDNSQTTRFLYDEFVRYCMRDYNMGYYDAEVLIQDVNPLNGKIFRDGWMYVTSLKDKRAPLYFAPYCTGLSTRSGITEVSKVIDTRVVKLADQPDHLYDGTPEQLEHWRVGWEEMRERALSEGFAEGEVRLLFLDKPITLIDVPLSKKSFKATGPTKQIPRQIPKGFSLGFDELLTAARSASVS